MPAEKDDDEQEEWPLPPYPGFRPLDDRMCDRKHTRRMAELLWAEVQRLMTKKQ